VITHPEKILFPDDGITKGGLAAYYKAIAPLSRRLGYKAVSAWGEGGLSVPYGT